MSQIIHSNKYIGKLSISHIIIRVVESKREDKTQDTFADRWIPFGPIILVILRPERDRTMCWVGIFELKFRKQGIEIFVVLSRVGFEFVTMDPEVGIADEVIIRLAWITGRVSGRGNTGVSIHDPETGGVRWTGDAQRSH